MKDNAMLPKKLFENEFCIININFTEEIYSHNLFTNCIIVLYFFVLIF